MKAKNLVHLDTPDDALQDSAAGSKAQPPKRQKDVHDFAHEERRQEAFESEYFWREQALHGFSVSREGLFGQLRLAMGAPALRLCLADPDAFAADAQRILFLCAHPPEVWNRLRADMATLQSAVDAWTDKNISVSEKLSSETLAMRIWLAAQENRHEPAPTSAPHGDDLGN
jgi:hypothetical protein